MKCKKCGRPMGKSGLCSHCDKEKIAKLAQPKSKKPLYLALGAVALVAVAALVLIFTLGGNDAETPTEPPQTPTEPAETTSGEPTISGKHHVQIEIQDYGTISVELDADAAPITVENFLKLANEGFYNGLTFHRIMKGFMMQGGDPEGTGMGGSDETIKGEFSANGVNNPLSHTRGAISMARNGLSMDSASSQFFIVHEDSTFLDGQYACFGYVTSGMDVVDAVCEDAKPTDNNGTIPAAQQPVITEIRVID